MSHIFRPTLVLFALLTIITGVAYPLLVTGLAQFLFPGPADGSLIVRDGKLVGSELIGQAFSDPKYFWGRPSATATYPNNGAVSGGSNMGPTNPALVDAVKGRIAALKAAGPAPEPVPVDLVTASGSGLDPHISPAAAYYQVARIAQARGLSEATIRALVDRRVEPPQLGFLGESRVNVLLLNLALDQLK